jgi:hypothetical protein
MRYNSDEGIVLQARKASFQDDSGSCSARASPASRCMRISARKVCSAPSRERLQHHRKQAEPLALHTGPQFADHQRQKHSPLDLQRAALARSCLKDLNLHAIRC